MKNWVIMTYLRATREKWSGCYFFVNFDIVKVTFPLFEQEMKRKICACENLGRPGRPGQWVGQREECFSVSPITSILTLHYLEDAVLFPRYFVSTFSLGSILDFKKKYMH